MKKDFVKPTRALLIAFALCVAVLLCGCGARHEDATPTVADCALLHEPEFGGVYIQMTIEDFNALGFQYGDSVNVSFSNGYTLEDLPYFNGYYTANGEPLLIAYPGYDYIKAAINNGDDLWTVAGLQEGLTGSITLAEKGRYLDIQNARDIHYTDAREDYASDIVFANFREIRVGDIRKGMLYRSASPCDNQHNRAPYVDALMKEAGISFILNLADNEEKIQKNISADGFNSTYFLSLYESGQVTPLALNMNFGSEEFQGKVVSGLSAMAEHQGPWLVHCTEGKDRTGFVCMLLEALCGASYEEIVSDYMITYANYYGITKQSDPDRYDVIVKNVLDPMICCVIGEDNADPAASELSACAERYLEDAGMSRETIAVLKAALTGGTGL